MHNPISGYHAPDTRFKVRIRSLAHNNLYLPLSMRSLPQINQLLEGVSPLTVFNCSTLQEARKAFYDLRMKFDFTYWAFLEFKVRDISRYHSFVPLRLNRFQYYIATRFLKDASNGYPNRYLISKTVPRCGLTTVVQAYILWRQKYHMDDSFTFVRTDTDMEEMIKTAAQSLHKNAKYYRIILNPDGVSAKFNFFYSPYRLDQSEARFVHLADMSKWYDPDGEDSLIIIRKALRGWKKKEAAIFVIEGDCPENNRFRSIERKDRYASEPVIIMRLSPFGDNPVFLYNILTYSNPALSSECQYIHLDNTIPEIP